MIMGQPIEEETTDMTPFLYEKLLLVNSYQDLIGQPLFCLFPIGIGIGIGIEIICMLRCDR
jgi:phosphotransferase system  glucose/maltose/N-acetylglucosamine-specific IIC component